MAGLSSGDTAKKRATRTRATRGAVKKSSRKNTVKLVDDSEKKRKLVRRATDRKQKADTEPAAEEKTTQPLPDTSDQNRRAPTPLSSVKARKRRLRQRLIVVGLLLAIGVGSSAAVGYTDSGYIDINEQILSQYPEEERASRSLPVQNTSSERKADGGLRGLGIGGAVPTPPPDPAPATTATSSASSTDAATLDSASSTPAVDVETVQDVTSASEADSVNTEEGGSVATTSPAA